MIFFTILSRSWEDPSLKNLALAVAGARFLKNRLFPNILEKNIFKKNPRREMAFLRNEILIWMLLVATCSNNPRREVDFGGFLVQRGCVPHRLVLLFLIFGCKILKESSKAGGLWTPLAARAIAQNLPLSVILGALLV